MSEVWYYSPMKEEKEWFSTWKPDENSISPYWIDGGVSTRGVIQNVEWTTEKLKEHAQAWQCSSCDSLMYFDNKDSRCIQCGAPYSNKCVLII